MVEKSSSAGTQSIALLLTDFLPAERAPRADVLADHHHLLSFDLVHTLFNTVPSVVLILNPQRQIIFANRALKGILGLTDLVEILGSRPGEALCCVHAKAAPGGCGTTPWCTMCGAGKALAAGLGGKAEVQECRLATHDGRIALDLRVSVSPVELEQRPYLLMVLEDLSAEKRRAVLERIFFHDLLNTVGGVKGYAELLDLADETEREIFTGRLNELADKLIEEINVQRELSAAERGELTLSLEPLDPAEVVASVLRSYERLRVARGKHLHFDRTDEVGLVAGDRTLLQRVFGNMVKNALEAVPPGATVRAGAEQVEHEVRFFVTNPGVLPREVELQLFKRSFSTKGEGRGLGTYSMRLLGEHYLGGRVGYHNGSEGSVTFELTLPVWEGVTLRDGQRLEHGFSAASSIV